MELRNICAARGLNARIVAKLEFLNPAGSVKDRVAKAMLDDGEARGLLRRGSVIIEPTSGNTGIGLAAAGVSRGYRVIIVMPSTMSVERRKIMEAYGAEVVLSDGEKGMRGAIEKAEELAASVPNGFIPSQFDNPANAAAHYNSTAPELWRDSGGAVAAFVAGVGTGGTITGIGTYLKEKNPDIKVIAVEPLSSPVLSVGAGGAHGIQGIGAGFVPSVLDTSVYDEVMTVSDADAFEFAREVGRRCGVLAGISSGAALCAAVRIAEREEYAGKTIATLFPDGGERYVSTALFGN